MEGQQLSAGSEFDFSTVRQRLTFAILYGIVSAGISIYRAMADGQAFLEAAKDGAPRALYFVVLAFICASLIGVVRNARTRRRSS